MDLNEIDKKIKTEISQESLFSLIATLENIFANLDIENKGFFLSWLEFEFLYNQISINDNLQVSMAALKGQFSSDANQELENISNKKKRTIEYLQKWLNEKKSYNFKVELPVIDLSDTTATEKIIYLQKLGVIEFLRDKEPFRASVNLLATVLSSVTGEKSMTLQSYLNPMFSSGIAQKNNPLTKTDTVAKVDSQLIKIGFNHNKPI